MLYCFVEVVLWSAYAETAITMNIFTLATFIFLILRVSSPFRSLMFVR